MRFSADLEWGPELGSGCIGQVFKGHVQGLPVAVKVPKLGGPLGYDHNAAAIQSEMKFAMRVRHSCLCPLLGWFAGPATFSVWEFVPSTVTMRDVLLQPIGCNLVGALTFLADTLAFLDAMSLTLFDCHPSDIFILDYETGAVKIIDWADGFDNNLAGNVALLPAAWHAAPGSRLSLVSSFGVDIAAKQINAAMVIHDDWRDAALSYFHHRLGAADWPQTNLPILAPRRRLPPLERPPPPPMAPPPPPPPPVT